MSTPLPPEGPAPHHPAPPPPPPAPEKKRPWWLFGCLGCGCLTLGVVALLAVLGVLGSLVDGGGGDTFDAPSDTPSVATETYVNSPEGLTGNLAANYVPFSFEYPATWEVVETGREPGASNFVKVERQVEEDFTAENFAVGYFSAPEGAAENPEMLRPLLDELRRQFAQGFPNFQPIGTGPAVLGGREGMYLTFSSLVEGTPRGDVELWGRVFLIPVEGGKGVAVVMLGTPVGTELRGPADLGQKGELPVIINSFRFGEGG